MKLRPNRPGHLAKSILGLFFPRSAAFTPFRSADHVGTGSIRGRSECRPIDGRLDRLPSRAHPRPVRHCQRLGESADTDDTLIIGRTNATLASILPGEALGVAADRGSDGSLTATAINIFLPSSGSGFARDSFRWLPGRS